MLRITAESEAGTTKIRLEGKLSGPWVDELERSWYATTETDPLGIVIDLSQVTFIDAEGKKLLAWMGRQGAVFQAVSCMTKCIVDEITKGGESAKRRC